MLRKTLITLALILTALPAYALSVKDFEAKPASEQSAFTVAFIDKVTGDNPQLANAIHDCFFVKSQGERFYAGLWNLYVELTAIDKAAKNGKFDPEKIQIEGVILKVLNDMLPAGSKLIKNPPLR